MRVTPVGLTLDKGVSDGWVAVADHDGTPWVALADAPLAGLDVAQAAVARAPVNVADARRTAADLNAFGLDLYKRLLADPQAKLNGKGAVISPASIAVALAMARAGARGATATQMDRVLRDSDWNDLGAGLGSLQQILAGYNGTWKDEDGTSHSLSLDVTNRAFGQVGWSILDGLPAADRRARSVPGSASSTTARTRTPPATPSTLGRAADQQPDQPAAGTDRRDGEHAARPRQRDLHEGQLAPRVRPGTDEEPHLHDGRWQLGEGPDDASSLGSQDIVLAQGNGWKATELRYAGADATAPLAMTLILPDDMRTFERQLSTGKLDAIQTAIKAEDKRIAKLKYVYDGDLNCPTYAYNVNLFLPKFGIDTKASIVPVLKSMGMTDAVNGASADFSGITGGRDMFIAKVIHQANIDVMRRAPPLPQRRPSRAIRPAAVGRRSRTRPRSCASTTRSCS